LKGHKLKVIVYEHVSGGGYAGQPIPPSILSEGFGMLRSVASDFKAAGNEVTVLLDARISKLNPPINAQCTVPIFYKGEPEKFLGNIAQNNDAIYLIAPETGQTLQSLAEISEKTGKISLNCESQVIKKVEDKSVFYETIQKFASTPKTVVLNIDDGLTKTKQTIHEMLGYPIVLKPTNGTSCSGLSLVTHETHLANALKKICAESTCKRLIAQEFVYGEDASVSLISTGKKAKALSLNKQNIILGSSDASSSYEGGIVPLDHRLKHEAFKAAERVTEAFPGLKGYVGVDLVLAENKPYIVDFNPRLTTSYVGLRRVSNFNVAEAIVNSVVKGKLPDEQENHRTAYFSKIETSKPTISAFNKAARLDAVISPPFPLNGSSKAVSLIIGEGANIEEATLKLEEAKKHLRNIIT
jgi:predicted ATP-grasp superfamily ATP-dependent carboligase